MLCTLHTSLITTLLANLGLPVVSLCNEGNSSCHSGESLCPLTKFEGGLNLLHEVDDDAVIWLESTVIAALVK